MKAQYKVEPTPRGYYHLYERVWYGWRYVTAVDKDELNITLQNLTRGTRYYTACGQRIKG
jgi:hypothetical protein